MAAPFLILVGILGILQRNGSDRLHYLPAIIVGFGLIISGPVSRSNRRKKLLQEIKKK